jgi:DNA-directed RNA polymerase specialized sigma subunit
MRPLLYSQLPEYVPLDVEEERALVIAAQAGDEAAMTKLLTTLHCLIMSMAQQRAWNSRSSFEDAVQNGFVGAIEGIMRFDISKGQRLSTYVRAWIFKEQYRSCQVRVVTTIRATSKD